MATVNMNCVEFYDPKPALKASHAQLTRLVLNKQRQPLQPIESQHSASQNYPDNDSLDDSLPSLEGLLHPGQNGDIPQVPHQNHEPFNISKRQVIDESHLLTDSITPNLVYVPGNSQRSFLADHSPFDGESDNGAEAGAASSDLLANIEGQDASECGLASQDSASTLSSLFGPSTPQDSEYPNTDCFFKDGQQRVSFTELDSAEQPASIISYTSKDGEVTIQVGEGDLILQANMLLEALEDTCIQSQDDRIHVSAEDFILFFAKVNVIRNRNAARMTDKVFEQEEMRWVATGNSRDPPTRFLFCCPQKDGAAAFLLG
ncbi:hypothetical protein V502_02307 [Pseudogymnoascus sp. VKM F-4520 (FW-2644)]|nr:hypothetical protein V502_02307 [Pseudogymnoascus sp. VKM F-4520 (FW-2644)]